MKKRRATSLVCLALSFAFLGAAGCAKKPAPADLVLLNGDVHTLDPAQPTARALVVNGDRITAVCSSDRQARRYVGPKTRVFDFLGKFVMPGLIDGRVNTEAAGAFLCGIDYRNATDDEGLRKEIRRVVDLLDDGEWITDGLWGAPEEGTAGGEAAKAKTAPWRPSRATIDLLTPNHPCFLARYDGKEWLANGAALATAGLDKARLPGLEIGTDGKPTGIVLPGTHAFEKVKNAVKPKPEERLLDEARAALQALRDAGITEIYDVQSPGQTKRFLEIEKDGALSCAIWILPEPARAAELRAQGFGPGLHPATKQKSSAFRYASLGGDAGAAGSGREARPAFSSDWPGTPTAFKTVLPTDLIYAAVTGAAPGPSASGTAAGGRKVTVEDMLRAYTLGNAAAGGEDDLRGSLKVGKRADIAVFDRSLIMIGPDEILEAKVTHTIVGGKVVYRRRMPTPAKASR